MKLINVQSFGNPFGGIADLKGVLERVGVFAVRGFISIYEAEALRRYVMNAFIPDGDSRSSQLPTLGALDYQRLDLGSYGGVHRFCRTFFLYEWNHQQDLIGNIFTRLTNLREHLMSMPDASSCFLSGSNPNASVFNATRVIHYPVGGGFMERHSDTNPPKVLQAFPENNSGNVVTLLSLTERGKDYQSGGGFICIGDQEIDLEAGVQFGDVIVYDESLVHGVNGIDIRAPIDLKSLKGRMVALTTPYPV